jgi:hypothetical protein
VVDLLFIIGVLGFFAFALAVAYGCYWLMGESS